MIRIIGDTHFSDLGIIRYENRPFNNTKEMDETLIACWNNTVDPDDTVFHIGDVAFDLSVTEIKAIVSRLNGHKVLVLGNHDTESIDAYRNIGFEEVYRYPIIVGGYFILSHEPLYMVNNSPYVNVFAHVHGNPAYKSVSTTSFCASCERIDYTPIKLESIRQSISRQRIVTEYGAKEI